MKRIILIFAILAGIHITANTQSHFKGGIGYYGENVVNPGIILEFEYERTHGERFSLPLRADIGFHNNSGFHAITVDIHKGFRRYFQSGLFLEQSIGAGVITKSFKRDYWYTDKLGQSIPHGNSSLWGFMPSVSFGAGYTFSRDSGGTDLIWVRPKIYWDLGFRGLHLPYAALQIGFTHTFKTK